MTVDWVDGSISRNEESNASRDTVSMSATDCQDLYKPFSASLAALSLLVGRVGKSRLTTRGFVSSTKLKDPAERRFPLASFVSLLARHSEARLT